MGTTKTASARALIDPKIKKEAEAILNELGLSVSKSFELYYRQIIAHRGLPFELQIPNKKTMKAIENSRQGKGKSFSSANELYDDLGIWSMRSIRRDTQFKRDVKRLKKQYKDFEKLKAIIQLLVEGQKLPPKTKDHRLKGTLKDCRECHIEPDWLLIYRIEGSELCLVRTGSHADLFE
jgi:mRNA interferase YafQ